MSTLNNYQENAAKTALYPKDKALEYLTAGLAAETGEITGKVAKYWRKDQAELPKEDLKAELGDVLWFVSEFARLLETPLEEIADENIKKLASRHARGTIKGDGDNR